MPQRLLNDSEFHAFRFALVLAVIALVVWTTNHVYGQPTSNMHNSPVNWTTSYTQAQEEAIQQNTPLMLFFSGSDWCPWTKKLRDEVFEVPEFARWSDLRLVPVIVDFPRTLSLPNPLATQNNALLERYRPHLTGFPTALFITPDGTVIGKLGYDPNGWHSWIKEAQKIVGKLDKQT